MTRMCEGVADSFEKIADRTRCRRAVPERERQHQSSHRQPAFRHSHNSARARCLFNYSVRSSRLAPAPHLLVWWLRNDTDNQLRWPDAGRVS